MVGVLEELRAAQERAREARNLELDRHLPREDAQITEGIKALLAINGGGIVSMLGFMQALISKGEAFKTFKYYGSNALLFFVLGLIATALVPALRVIYINSLLFDWTHERLWEASSYAMWGISFLLFIVGVVFVGLGVQNGLP